MDSSFDKKSQWIIWVLLPSAWVALASCRKRSQFIRTPVAGPGSSEVQRAKMAYGSGWVSNKSSRCRFREKFQSVMQEFGVGVAPAWRWWFGVSVLLL